ncbi:MAG: serine/threonine-protein kinase [Verrucomicrobiota bacterium]
MSSLAKVDDRYRVIRPVGSGGGGSMYLAEDVSTGKNVALKHLSKRQAHQSALNEFATVIRLRHPNIINCLDFYYRSPSDCVIVYEYIEGGSLRDLMEQRPKWSYHDLVEFICQALDGLSFLHQNKFIHCDIKPENILVRRTADGSNQYILTDFGIAQRSKPFSGKSNCPAGSPAYIAPEMLYDEYSYNADLYSLGVVIYEILCGKRPFEGSPEEIIRQHLGSEPDFNQIPDSYLRNYTISLLEKDRHNRISTANEARELINLLAHNRNNTQQPKTQVSAPNEKSSKPRSLNQTCLNLEQIGEATIPNQQNPLLGLNVANQPLLCIDRARCLETIDPLTAEPLNESIPKHAAPTFVCEDNSVVFAQRDGLKRWNLKTKAVSTISSICRNPQRVAVSANGNYFASSNYEVLFVCRRGDTVEYRLDKRQLGFDPIFRVSDQGDLWSISRGVVPTYRRWDSKGRLTREVSLQGLVMAYSDSFDLRLVVCLSKSSAWHYTFHLVDHFDEKTATLDADRVQSISITSAGPIVLLRSRQVMRFNESLTPEMLGPMSANTDQLIFTNDNTFIFEVSNQKSSQLVRTYINHGH